MAPQLKLHDTYKENVQDIQLVLRSARDWDGARSKKSSHTPPGLHTSIEDSVELAPNSNETET